MKEFTTKFKISSSKLILVACLILSSLYPALADDTTVITAASATSSDSTNHPSLVFTSSTRGYQFYLSTSGGPIRYSVTNDGGLTWSPGINIGSNSESLASPTVWYDGWTAGDSTQSIHMIQATGGGYNPDILYERLTIQPSGALLNDSHRYIAQHNTSSDSRASVAKASDGTVFPTYLKSPYYDSNEDGESFQIYSCASDCALTAPITKSFVQNSGYSTGDDIIIRPIAGNKMIAFIWDISANTISYKLYNPTARSWSATIFLANAIDSASYRSAWGAVSNKATGEVYLVFNNNVTNAAGALKTYVFNASGALTITAKTDVIVGDIRQADIAIDENSGSVYVAFIRDGGSASKFEVYRSTNTMTSWVNLATTDDPFSELYIADRNYIGLSLNQSSANVIGASLRSQNEVGRIYYVKIADLSPAGPTCVIPNTLSINKADNLIDNDVHATDSVQRSPTTVFVSQTVGYMFMNDASRNPVYRKTTNGGATWGARVTLASATTSTGLIAWYDKWTPGDNGNKIHMIFGSTVTSPDNLNYMAFDTSTDTVSAPVKINNTTTNTLSDTARYSITKGRNGTLYATTSGANGPLVQCSTACTSGGNWTEITNYPFKTATATHHDLKLLSLKSDKLLALQWDITAHQIYYSLYTPSLGTWTAKTSLATAVDSTTYLGAWGATVNKNTGDAYLCFNNNVNNTSGSIQTAKFNDSGLIAGPLATGLTGQNIQCDLAYNEHSGAIVLSRNQVLGSNLSRITVSQSIDNMVNWSNFKTINLTHRNYTQAGLNFSSDRKIYAWYLDDTNHDIYGNTILNIDPSRDRLFTNQGVGDWLHFF